MPDPVVYLVDDDIAFLHSMERLLRASGFTVSTFSSAQSFLGVLNSEMTGCVIADLLMPGLSGLDLQEALLQTGNPIPIIFLSGQGDIPTTVRAMRGGAEDFLTKLAPKEELLAVVKRALAREARERAERQRRRAMQCRLEKLSAREREVLALVVRGLMNKHISAELGIHERTVKLHRTNITRKLNVRSVAELTKLTGEAGMFP